MRYWVYINDKVDGPYDETNLVTLQGFTPDTLICSEEVASNGGQEWVKASSVFEFDEVPVNDQPAPQPADVQPAPQPAARADGQTQALLAQLQALTSGMSALQSKLDAMQHNLDHALEQNQQLADQVAHLSHPAPLETPVVSEDPRANTITLTRHDMSAEPAPETTQKEPSFPSQAAPEEEEVIIRSALDSLYGGKPVELEDTFQDLMPEKTAEQQARKQAEDEQAVHNIEPELEFIPVPEENQPAPAAAKPTLDIQPTPVATSEEAQPLSADALSEIEKEMTSLSLAETQPEQPANEQPAPQEQPQVVKEALITTPGADEAAKDALINELTASPKEDILDQIIAEHQQPAPATQAAESPAGELALGAAAAGLAAAAVVSLIDNPSSPQTAPVAVLATDKNNPDKLEEVLPAQQMPADNPAPQAEPQPLPADLPSVDTAVQTGPVETQPQEETAPQIPVADTPDVLPQPQPEETTTPQLPVAQEPEQLPQQPQEAAPVAADLPGLEEQAGIEAAVQAAAAYEPTPAELLHEETVEELVPQAAQEPEGFYVKEEPAPQEQAPAPEEPAQPDASAPTAGQPNEAEVVQAAQEEAQAQEPAPEEPVAAETDDAQAPQEEAPTQEEEPVHTSGTITDKDLNDAFGNDDSEPIIQTSTVNTADEPLPEGNPNELTEIELKEGSTYLISDFVPPAQLDNKESEEEKKAKEEEANNNKKQETIFQDMLATVTKSQSTKALDTDGLPPDLAATQVNLENTIQAKRGASLDIKTVPMIPEPAKTDRLDVNDLNDVNAQHDLKTTGGLAKSTKTVIVALVGLLLLIIVYVLLGMMKLLPASVNLFAGKQQAVSSQASQEMLAEQPALAAPAVEEPQDPTPAEQAQEKVQNFPLPNGFLLKGFIESKHATISPDLITWETTEAVEADNYSVTVKVPPENPQNFKTVYRFNYNMVSGLLDPTVSDAKNLLDQAYGIQPQASAQATTAPAAKTTTPRTGTRRGTTRKR